METSASDVVGANAVLFKSYYVVWKLLSSWSDQPTHAVFKSYYVVWKPVFSAINFEMRWEFKSYYVVWKLFDILDIL